VGGFCAFVTSQDYFGLRGKAGGKVGQVAISVCYSPSALTWTGVGKSYKMTIQRHYGSIAWFYCVHVIVQYRILLSSCAWYRL